MVVKPVYKQTLTHYDIQMPEYEYKDLVDFLGAVEDGVRFDARTRAANLLRKLRGAQ